MGHLPVYASLFSKMLIFEGSAPGGGGGVGAGPGDEQSWNCLMQKVKLHFEPTRA